MCSPRRGFTVCAPAPTGMCAWLSGIAGEHTDPRPRSLDHQDHARRVTPMTMTDYDAPRRPAVELDEDSLEELQARRASAQSPVVEVDETEAAEGFELPGADLSDE